MSLGAFHRLSFQPVFIRLHNVTGSVACQRKILNLARDYAKKREAFGDAIDNYSLHLQTMSQVKQVVS